MNARRLRGDRKTDEVAKAATAVGLKWGTGRIADLEAGRVSPTLPTLLALAQAFGDLLGRRIGLAELLAPPASGEVAQAIITDSLVVDLVEVCSVLRGKPVDLTNQARPIDEMLTDSAPTFEDVATHQRPELFVVWSGYGEAEDRAARALGLDKGQMVRLMVDTWGTTLSKERDERAGPKAGAQARGHIARQLKAELQRELEAQRDGND